MEALSELAKRQLAQKRAELEGSDDLNVMLRAQGAVSALSTFMLNLRDLYREVRKEEEKNG